MLIASDGRIFIFAVFDSDGYECKDFVGAFETDNEAELFAEGLRMNDLQEWEDRYQDEYIPHGPNRRQITVECVTLGYNHAEAMAIGCET